VTGRAHARAGDEAGDGPGAPALALTTDAAQRLLEELLYERVLTVVRLFELRGLERDLEARIDALWARAGLDGPDRADPPSRVVAATLIDRAWKRVEATWQRERRVPP